MSRTSLVFNIVLCAALLGVCFYVWRLHEKLTTAELHRQGLSTEVDALKSRLTERDQQLAKAAMLPPASSNTASGAKDGGVAAPASAIAAAARKAQQEALFKSPEMQQLIQIQRRNNIDFRFAWLFRKLNLPPTELERLKDLLVERQNASSDVYDAARTVGMKSSEQLDRLAADAVAQVDNAIQSTLGETVYQQFKQYEQTAGQRGVVVQLDRRLSYTASPLTVDQTDRLVELLIAAPAARISAPEGGFNPYQGPRGIFALTAEVVEKSRAFLTQTQVDAFRELQAQAELERQVQERRNAVEASAGRR